MIFCRRCRADHDWEREEWAKRCDKLAVQLADMMREQNRLNAEIMRLKQALADDLEWKRTEAAIREAIGK